MKWIRGRGKLDFRHPKTYLTLGLKDSGKSSLLEVCGTRFPKVVDLFGSRDNEGLAWCRVNSKNEVLFLTGDAVQINGPWDSLQLRQITLKDLEPYPVVVSVSAFYHDMDEEFYSLNKIIYKVLFKRTHWRRLWCILIREASNFLYSRIKVVKNQTIAKADFIYLLREMRHMGYSIGVDTIRWTSLDKEVRDVADYTFIKRVGTQGLPWDLHYLYGYISPQSLMNPPPWAFVVIDGRGPIGVGRFDFPQWHKKEKEDILGELDLKPKYGERIDYGDRARKTVSDYEHESIMAKRAEGVGPKKRKGMGAIGDKVHRSPATVMKHIKKHNEMIRKRGTCEICLRVHSKYAKEVL